MKIMQVIPNFGYGGAEVMCANLAIELKKMGHDVLVVSLYSLKTSIVDEMVGKGVRFVTLGKKGGIDFSFFLKLARIIHKEKPDVVHSHRNIPLATIRKHSSLLGFLSHWRASS